MCRLSLPQDRRITCRHLRVCAYIGYRSAMDEPRRKRMHERRLQQPALVMPLLRPRIGKEDVDAEERRGRNHPPDDVDGIVAQDANIREPLRVDPSQ